MFGISANYKGFHRLAFMLGKSNAQRKMICGGGKDGFNDSFHYCCQFAVSPWRHLYTETPWDIALAEKEKLVGEEDQWLKLASKRVSDVGISLVCLVKKSKWTIHRLNMFLLRIFYVKGCTRHFWKDGIPPYMKIL